MYLSLESVNTNLKYKSVTQPGELVVGCKVRKRFKSVLVSYTFVSKFISYGWSTSWSVKSNEWECQYLSYVEWYIYKTEFLPLQVNSSCSYKTGSILGNICWLCF